MKSQQTHTKTTGSEKKYDSNKRISDTPEYLENHSLKQPSWHSSVMCFFGIHTGIWAYVSDHCCEQLRQCAACGRTNLRTRHKWDGGFAGNGESRKCVVCGKIEFRGNTREILCAGLQKLGVSAAVAGRGRLEEASSPNSIGLVEIDRSPIHWANVTKWYNEGWYYATDYGVPDSNTLPKLRLRSVRVRRFPILGSVVDVRWIGKDMETGVIGRLNADIELKTNIIGCKAEIIVHTSPECGCWLIAHNSAGAPSPELWACYERVAARLPATGGRFNKWW
jgi:hypothetical protein